MIGLLFLFAACQEKVTSPARVDTLPSIFPDYVGVTIPSTIAPLNFRVTDDGVEAVDVVIAGTKGKPVRLNGRLVDIPAKQWHELLESNKGDSIEVKVSVRQGKKWKEYRPFPIYVSPFPIDYGLVYRLLAPGYEVYSKMGIYERELSTFRQTPLFENTQVTAACINCHAFNRTEPTPSSVHVRGGHGATVIDTGDRLEFLDTKADGQLSACVYPYWHPSGEYIAYSVNKTNQAFHLGGKKPIEVFDQASDVVVYHPRSHRILTTPLLSTASFETFPAFSPDGRTLYFCSAEQKEMPVRYKDVKYSLCSIAFHPEDGTFGDPDRYVDLSPHAGQKYLFPQTFVRWKIPDVHAFRLWELLHLAQRGRSLAAGLEDRNLSQLGGSEQ